MLTKKNEKYENKFCCVNCNFNTSKKTDYERHLLTAKHKKSLIVDESLHIISKKNELIKEYICVCGKKYNSRQGLYNHKKKCNNKKEEKEKKDYETMFIQLINENKEMRNMLIKQQEQISELIPKVGNNINNINSNNKNKFNINVFLNEKCKDALSMDEFINKIEVSMKNLLTTKEKGQTHGISNIIIENMNKLSLYERPMHCTDKKRETLYVKNNEWEKDDNKTYINKALKKVESKQLKNLNVWLEQHPNYMNIPSEQEEFAKLMSECGKSVDDGREKIIKKLCDNVYLEKTE